MTMPEQKTHITGVEINAPKVRVETWKPQDIISIANLETDTWAPWLRKPLKHITTIATHFPDTQLVARDEKNKIAGILTTNRINWDGHPSSLTTWDDVAGGSVQLSDYSTTYKPDGNTLCLMSMDVTPGLHGVAPQLLEEIRAVAKELGITHIISSFRPSGYGNYKQIFGQVNFEEYCNQVDINGESIDPWLKSVFRQGMKPLRVEPRSMIVTVDKKTFEQYKDTYNPELWEQMPNGTWECGETGSWYATNERATYVESNLWGEIPIEAPDKPPAKKYIIS